MKTNADLFAESKARSERIQKKFSCECKRVSIKRRRYANGAIVVCEQCEKCGRQVRTMKRDAFDLDTLPWYDEEQQAEWNDSKQTAYRLSSEQLQREIAEAQEEQSAEWWAKYNQYLKSRQWYTIRERVLVRDDHTCQACLRNKATQVHHLSYQLYDQLGYSLAHELIAICHQCHHAIHPHMADTQQDSALYNPFLELVR